MNSRVPTKRKLAKTEAPTAMNCLEPSNSLRALSCICHFFNLDLWYRTDISRARTVKTSIIVRVGDTKDTTEWRLTVFIVRREAQKAIADPIPRAGRAILLHILSPRLSYIARVDRENVTNAARYTSSGGFCRCVGRSSQYDRVSLYSETLRSVHCWMEHQSKFVTV